MNGRRIVSAAIAYDRLDNGETIILVINQAIEIPTMENNLLCLMQMRVNGVSVNDTPKVLVDSPDESTHAI